MGAIVTNKKLCQHLKGGKEGKAAYGSAENYKSLRKPVALLFTGSGEDGNEDENSIYKEF